MYICLKIQATLTEKISRKINKTTMNTTIETNTDVSVNVENTTSTVTFTDIVEPDIKPSVQEETSLTTPFDMGSVTVENQWTVKQNNNTKKRIQPLDTVITWIDSEYDNFVRDAKYMFLDIAMRNLKKQDFTDVYRAYDIVDYLSEASLTYIRMIANHKDTKNNKIARLYEWRNKGKFVYILAIDDDSETNTWLDDRRAFYNDVASKGMLSDGKFDKKSYSILRRNCLKDFANKFTSTWFFKDFDTAKRAITMKVYGYVQFLRKENA